MGHKLFLLIVLFAVAAVFAAPAAIAADKPLPVTITKAPVAPDGTAAGAVTDFVLTFVNRDPNVKGIGLPTKSTVEVDLPSDFVNTKVGTNTVIILQGWPQSPIVPFRYSINITGNKIKLTMTSDFLPGSDGEGGPGPKQVHLLLNTFRNPKPGMYAIPLRIDAGPGSTYAGVGTVQIIPKAVPNVNIVSFGSGGGPPPPFNNPVYQNVKLGNNALVTRLFIWNKGSAPFVGVDLMPTGSPDHYRMMLGRRTVGNVWIDAPAGAWSYAMTSSGRSGLVLNPVTGVPTAGLDTQFMPDPRVAGDYKITFRLNGGNTEQQFIRVR